MNAVALRPAVKRTFAIRFRYLLMNAVALRPAVKRTFAIRFRYLLMNAVALRPAVKRTFAIRFRYLLMNAVALRPAFKKRCALCVIRTHIFLYLMNYLVHRYHCFFPHGAFFLFLWFCSCLMTSLLMIPGIKRNLFQLI